MALQPVHALSPPAMRPGGRAASPPRSERSRSARSGVRAGLHLVRHGHGPRHALCLHGLAGSADTFLPLLPHLPHDVSLFAIDLPGYGASAPPVEWTHEGIADAILDGLDAHGIEGPIDVVGNCSGAIVAVALKERAPERFGTLWLVEPFASIPWFFAIFTWPVLGALFFWSTFYTPIGRALTNLRLGSMRGEDVDMTDGFSRCPPSVPLRYLRVLGGLGDASRFAGLAARVALVRGARTFGAIREGVDAWRAVWPDAAVHVVADAGHVPFRESPGALAATIFADDPFARHEGA